MIITEYSVGMESKYSMSTKTTASISSNAQPVVKLPGVKDMYVSSKDDECENGFLSSMNYFLDKHGEVSQVDQPRDNSDKTDIPTKVKFQTLSYLLRILFGKVFAGENTDFRSFLDEISSGSNRGYMLETTHASYTYEESQELSFSTAGVVKTVDGKEINFGINFSMSESFKQEFQIDTARIREYSLMDPLVINLDAETVNLSDQTFMFDLNCDGELDEISQLGYGSAFLALDKNGNGVIDDGSELFGAKTGNGFYELSLYDEDGNGWIDEADDIFDKLKIMTVDEDGKQRLIDLKKGDVGAIFLGYADTQYNMNNSDNELNGVIRRTGVFMRESGSVGTIQHVDLAVS